MLENIARKMHREEEGFTLIELMVVVLIIGILIAIALPTFLGARSRAQDKAAQSSLRNALVSAKTCFTDNDSYKVSATVLCDSVALTALEPSLTFQVTGTASAGPNEVSVLASSSTLWYGAALSASGTCFYIKDDAGSGGGTTYSKSADACTGTQAALETFTTTGW